MEKDTNEFTFFENEKRQNDNSPDFTGKIVVNGEERWLSVWKNVKEGKKTFYRGLMGDKVEPRS